MRRRSFQLLRLFSLLWILGWMACGPSMEKKVPGDLVGVWVTPEPRYQGCSMEITASRIVFENPTTGAEVNRIKGIETIPEGSKTLYRIHYEDKEGLKYILSLYREKADEKDVLYYKHQPKVKWGRRE